MADTKSSTKPLSPARINAARPAAKDYALSDAGSGLTLLVSTTGAKSFRWYVKHQGERVKVTLGRFPEVSLAEARNLLDEAKQAHREGRLQAWLDARRPAEQAPGGAYTVRKAVDEFLASLERKRPEQARRTFDVDVLPKIGDLPVKAVTRDHVRAVVTKVVKRGSPVMARHVLALLRQFFAWALDEAHVDASPAAGRFQGKRALGTRKAQPSTRFLSPAEIVAFSKALAADRSMEPPTRAALKLLLLLGVRTGEIRLARWEHVADLDGKAPTLTVPVEHQKAPKDKESKLRPWVVPLPPRAVELLKDLKALAKTIGSPYVVPSIAKPGRPLSEKAVGHAMRRLFAGEQPALRFAGEHPTPHDLRRTVRSHLESTLHVPEAICERVLNHVRPGMVETYARGDYLDDRRAALVAWDSYLAGLLTGKPAKVVPLRTPRDLLESARAFVEQHVARGPGSDRGPK